MAALAATLLLTCLVLPAPAGAEKGGPSASGSFQFTAAGLAQTVDFNVRTDKGGVSNGELTFSGAAEIPDQDVDGESAPGAGGFAANVFYTARFDCLEVNGKKAVMSGVVTGSTLPAYIGQRVLLVVEDNGEGVGQPAPDKLTWGVYKKTERGWTPSDAEVEGDTGATLTWTARDFEREPCPSDGSEDCVPPNEGVARDEGISSKKDETVTCKSFPLSSYSLEDVAHGDGNIQVRP
jgi:hypothetical protein